MINGFLLARPQLAGWLAGVRPTFAPTLGGCRLSCAKQTCRPTGRRKCAGATGWRQTSRAPSRSVRRRRRTRQPAGFTRESGRMAAWSASSQLARSTGTVERARGQISERAAGWLAGLSSSPVRHWSECAASTRQPASWQRQAGEPASEQSSGQRRPDDDKDNKHARQAGHPIHLQPTS